MGTYCREYKTINQLPSLPSFYNRYKPGSLASSSTQIVQTLPLLARNFDFVQFFVISLTLTTITNYTRNPNCPALPKVAALPKLLSFLNTNLAVDS